LISDEVIEDIKNRVDIAEVIGEYVHLTRKGDRYWGLSPFKTEKTPSFTVTPSRQMYYCFSTQKGGNVFSFIMEMEGMTFPEAVEYLGKKVGIQVQGDQQVDDRAYKERAALHELYDKVQKAFHFLLTSKDIGRHALEYIRNREFSDEIIERFSLGYSHPEPFWLYDFLAKKGYSADFLAKSGLFSRKNPRWSLFSNRLMFPIQRHQGEAVAFGGRLLDGDGPKYINSPETGIYHKRSTLYGLHQAKDAIKKEGYFILCEGYLDVLAFSQSGIANAVAPLGTAFTADQARLLRRYAQKALLVFDGDAAGVAASRKTAIILETEGMSCDILALENAEDPADIMLKNGSQALKNLVESSFTALEFLLTKAVSMSDIKTPDGKDQVLEQLFPYIRSIQSAIKQEASLQIIAERIGVSSESIISSFRQKSEKSERMSRGAASSSPDRSIRPREKVATPGNEIRENSPPFQLMLATAIHPEHFAYVRTQLSHQEISGATAQLLYSLLEEQYRNQNLSFDKIIADINNEALKNFILKKAAADEYGSEPGKYIGLAVLRVRYEIQAERRREVEMLMKQAEQRSENQLLRELLEEKIYLDGALQELKDSIHDRTAE
jgi:DNA primase